MLIHGKDFQVPYLYQPVFGQEDSKLSLRTSAEAAQRIKTILDADRVYNKSQMLRGSICDVGSNIGHVSFSLEKAGCLGHIHGTEIDSTLLDISKHIATSVNSTCTFSKNLVDAETYLLLSVTHHLMLGQGMDSPPIREFFGRLVNSSAKTIYIEQATHLEYPEWALKLVVKTNPYIYFMELFKKLTKDQFIVRLVGMNHNHLGTLRPIYQLKRKINEKIVANGIEYTAFDHFKVSFVGYVPANPEDFNYYFAIDPKGNKVFLKNKFGKWFPPDTYYEGLTLYQILKFGILQFYDLAKIREQVFALKHSDVDYEDFKVWNIIIENDSTMRLIDKERREGYPQEYRNMDSGTTLRLLRILFY